MTAGAAVFGSLAGGWMIDRVIEPRVGVMTGIATFRPVATGRLHYREDGQVTLATGCAAPVFREYVYVLDGDRILVCFADGERPGPLMHTLRLEGTPDDDIWLCGVDVHHCGDDIYEGTYRFDGGDRFTVDMRVTGPAKDYRMVTRYHRVRS